MQPKAKDAQMFLYGFKTLQKKKRRKKQNPAVHGRGMLNLHSLS